MIDAIKEVAPVSIGSNSTVKEAELTHSCTYLSSVQDNGCR